MSAVNLRRPSAFNLSSLLVINSLSNCLSGNILISPLFLKDSFENWEFLVGSSFPFSTLNMSSHCLLSFNINPTCNSHNKYNVAYDTLVDSNSASIFMSELACTFPFVHCPCLVWASGYASPIKCIGKHFFSFVWTSHSTEIELLDIAF